MKESISPPQYLVNRKFIVEVNQGFVVLTDKTVLPISRRRRGEFLVLGVGNTNMAVRGNN